MQRLLVISMCTRSSPFNLRCAVTMLHVGVLLRHSAQAQGLQLLHGK